MKTCKFDTRISEPIYTLFSENQVTSLYLLLFLQKKLKGILIFSHQLKVFVLQFSVSILRVGGWSKMLFKAPSNLYHSVLTPLHCTMADSPWTEECMHKIHEIHKRALKNTEISKLSFSFFNILYLCWRKMTEKPKQCIT